MKAVPPTGVVRAPQRAVAVQRPQESRRRHAAMGRKEDCKLQIANCKLQIDCTRNVVRRPRVARTLRCHLVRTGSPTHTDSQLCRSSISICNLQFAICNLQ